MTVNEQAIAYHANGCNCAQSVLCALSAYTGLDENTAQRIAAGFGGGVRCGEICGAISGGVMALGMADARTASAKTMQLTGKFRAEHGCVRCQELTQKYGGKGHCDVMISFAAQAAEAILKESR